LPEVGGDADEAGQPVRPAGGGGAERSIVGQAAEQKLLRTGRVRADTTVICANVAYPTEVGLLAKAVVKLVRTARRVQAAGGAPGHEGDRPAAGGRAAGP
jgi:IS5 family transposase